MANCYRKMFMYVLKLRLRSCNDIFFPKNDEIVLKGHNSFEIISIKKYKQKCMYTKQACQDN